MDGNGKVKVTCTPMHLGVVFRDEGVGIVNKEYENKDVDEVHDLSFSREFGTGEVEFVLDAYALTPILIVIKETETEGLMLALSKMNTPTHLMEAVKCIIETMLPSLVEHIHDVCEKAKDGRWERKEPIDEA